MKITKEDFSEWLDNPVTEEVHRALRVLAEQSRQKWIERSWGGGETDPLLLADLRARAEVVNDLCELTFEEIEDTLNEERERPAPDRVQGADPAQAG